MMKKLLILSSLVLTFFACAKQPQTSEEIVTKKVKQDTSAVVEVVIPAVVDEPVQMVMPPKDTKLKPTAQPKSSYSSSSGSNYSSSSDEDDYRDENDYWEEKRKHSPNDNYLLGFDEDVDDVHDMEIYIEDY